MKSWKSDQKALWSLRKRNSSEKSEVTPKEKVILRSVRNSIWYQGPGVKFPRPSLEFEGSTKRWSNRDCHGTSPAPQATMERFDTNRGSETATKLFTTELLQRLAVLIQNRSTSINCPRSRSHHLIGREVKKNSREITTKCATERCSRLDCCGKLDNCLHCFGMVCVVLHGCAVVPTIQVATGLTDERTALPWVPFHIATFFSALFDVSTGWPGTPQATTLHTTAAPEGQQFINWSIIRKSDDERFGRAPQRKSSDVELICRRSGRKIEAHLVCQVPPFVESRTWKAVEEDFENGKFFVDNLNLGWKWLYRN